MVFNISGGTVQIMPKATRGVQNFYFASPDKAGGVRAAGCEDAAKRMAREVLQLYYPTVEELDGIISRLGHCRNATAVANLVVNDIQKNTILSRECMVRKDFIEALRPFLTFKSGATVNNIRQLINGMKEG